jgi:hypothetical protein
MGTGSFGIASSVHRSSFPAARHWLFSMLFWSVPVLLLGSCASQVDTLTVIHESSPAPAGSLVPQMIALQSGAVGLSWLEPLPDSGYRFRMAVRRNGSWSEPRTIASGAGVIMFTADLPGLQQFAGGRLLAYWEMADRSSADPYATAIHLAYSTDEGVTWSPSVTPSPDDVSGSHSFLASFRLGQDVGLVWLDPYHTKYVAPEKPDGKGVWMGAMGLRFMTVTPAGRISDAPFIDPITCECCPNAAAVTSRGPIVAYRNREVVEGTQAADVRNDAGTVRDIYTVRLEHGRWTEPVRVNADNWVINACPDNGPAVDASGDHVALAWWTAPALKPRVSVAFSSDAASTFAAPIHIDHGSPDGQVTVALLPDARRAVVGWLESGQAWARIAGSNGAVSDAIALGASPRRNRLPSWIPQDDGVLAAWTDSEKGRTSVRVSRLIVH